MQICLIKDIQIYLKDLRTGEILKLLDSSIYNWDENSTYVKKPPFFENMTDKARRI